MRQEYRQDVRGRRVLSGERLVAAEASGRNGGDQGGGGGSRHGLAQRYTAAVSWIGELFGATAV